ncbi:cholinesterase 1-like [Patiria miniata]|uniref:Carboxylic ester hydrolase n=1 Tax=Patiria miniata TaxID=46514 RepID=A0A914BB01_PATMI|nr:cholinesterase 1-like [Patiria miniata]
MLVELAILTIMTALGPFGALCENPRVNINGLGAVVGETVHFKRETYPVLDTFVDVYRGIPFAEPPERFAKPQPKKPWSGDLDATVFGSICPQLDSTLIGVIGAEDCLYMNIWVPNQASNAAVMLFIHGGAFLVGSGSMEGISGLPLAAYHDVIVVNFNYRLGPFGFLSTGDDNFPGNIGMWDQLEALKWVKEHIADFGGDSSRITIFGQSAGGASVSLMTLAKQSWGYYDRAIMESGIATAPWALMATAKAREDALNLGKAALCWLPGSSGSSSRLLSCLKRKSMVNIMKAASWVLRFRLVNLEKANEIPFVPTIDGEFLTKDPAELLRLGDFKNSDVLLGTERDDGTLISMMAVLSDSLRHLHLPPKHPVIDKEKFDELLNIYVYIEHDQEMLDLISANYTTADQSNYLKPLYHTANDEGFACPTDTVVKAFAAANPNTYQYQMTHVSSFHLQNQTWPDTVQHGDELGYVFGSTFNPDLKPPLQLTEEEVDMSVDVMRYWTNFAKTGNPNDNETPVAKTWHKFNTQTMYYKDLSPPMVDKQYLLQDKCYLWNVELPDMVPSIVYQPSSEENEPLSDIPCQVIDRNYDGIVRRISDRLNRGS